MSFEVHYNEFLTDKGFNEAEIEELAQRTDSEKLKKQIDRYKENLEKTKVETETQEKADNSMDALEKRVMSTIKDSSVTLDVKLISLTNFMGVSNTTMEGSINSHISSTAEDFLASKKSELNDKVKEKIKDIPFIGGFVGSIFNWSQKEDDGWIGKMLGGAKKSIGVGILGFLGLKGFQNEIDKFLASPETIKTNLEEERKTTLKRIKPVGEVRVEDEEEKEKEKEKLEEKVEKSPEEKMEIKMERYKTIGQIVVSRMGGENFDGEDNYPDTSDVIIESGKTFNELNLSNKKNFSYTEKITDDNFNKTKKAFCSDDMVIFYDSFLGEERIAQLLENQKTNIKLFELGIDSIDGYDWQKLEISTIMKLLSISMAGMSYGAIISLGQFGTDVLSDVLSFKKDNNIEEIKELFSEEMEEFQSEVMPKELIGKFLDGHFKQASSFDYDKEKIKEMLNIDGIEFNKYIEKIISFRDFIKESILTDEKLTFGDDDNINKSLNFRDIVKLYLVTEGEIPNVAEGKISDPVMISLIYPWLYQALYREGNAGSYAGKLAQIVSGTLKEDEYYSKHSGVIQVIISNFLGSSVDRLGEKVDMGLNTLKVYVEDNPYETAGLALAALAINKVGAIISFIPYARLFVLGASGIAYFMYKLDEGNRKNAVEILKESGGTEQANIIDEAIRMLNEYLSSKEESST